jgi:hypothetical protein
MLIPQMYLLRDIPGMFVCGLHVGDCSDCGFLECDIASQHAPPKLLLHSVTTQKTTIRLPVRDGKELTMIVKSLVYCKNRNRKETGLYKYRGWLAKYISY